MPARVFACVLADDADGLTASELAERLQVSPAAISGAVRYLADTGMVVRGREPGARRDHYRVGDDLWYEMQAGQLALVRRWMEGMAYGAELVGRDTRAGRRLEESSEFCAFLLAEMPLMLERWHERRRQLGLGSGDAPRSSTGGGSAPSRGQAREVSTTHSDTARQHRPPAARAKDRTAKAWTPET